MAYCNQMTAGVMLTPSIMEYYEYASRKTGDYDGVQNEAKELKFDLHLPLIQVLDSVFSHYGRVIIDFPGTSDEQVRNINNAHNINCTINGCLHLCVTGVRVCRFHQLKDNNFQSQFFY